MLKKLIVWWKYSKILNIIIKIENSYFRKKLNNTDFTILTPNCMAGLIYHRLGERFNSPTIDTSINTGDFCAMLENLDYYFSKDIVEYNIKENPSDFPIGIIEGNGNDIPDIKINFVHYDTFEQGQNKWNERKKRINRGNLYVIMCDVDNIHETDCEKAGYVNEEDLDKFEKFQCNNKALLTRNSDNSKEYAYYIKPNYKRAYPLSYMNRDIIGLNGFEKHFDFVSFLNKE